MPSPCASDGVDESPYILTVFAPDILRPALFHCCLLDCGIVGNLIVFAAVLSNTEKEGAD